MSSAVLTEARTAHLSGDHRKAIDLTRGVLKSSPRNLDAYRILGLAYMGAQKPEKALEVMHRGLEEFPGDGIIAANLAAQYWALGQDDLAMKWIERSPPTTATAYTRSLLLLKAGDYARGWRDYDLRFEVGQSKLLQPRETMWDGRRLKPDDVLTVWSEQGVGDVVQFARFLPLAKERAGCKLRFACYPPVQRLFEGFPGVDEIGTEVGGIHIPIMSLPRVLGVRLEDVTGDAYLSIKPRNESSDRQAALRAGLCWHSHTANPEFVDRHIPPRMLRPIHGLHPRVECRSLQYGEGDFHPSDFYETAQAVAACDLVITIDTSVAHIAGAMGIPVWIMLRYQGCFRWLRDRTDCPWYDSARLYRQTKLRDWQSVVDKVVIDLKELVSRP